MNAIRQQAARLLRVHPRQVRISRDRDGSVRIGCKYLHTRRSRRAARALGIHYVHDPRLPIGEGADALSALLSLTRRTYDGGAR